MYEKRGVQAAFKVTKPEQGHLLAGAREALLARNVPFAAGIRLHALAAVRKLGLFSSSILPWFVISHNMSMINTTSNWLCSGAFQSLPVPSLRNHWPPTSDYCSENPPRAGLCQRAHPRRLRWGRFGWARSNGQ